MNKLDSQTPMRLGPSPPGLKWKEVKKQLRKCNFRVTKRVSDTFGFKNQNQRVCVLLFKIFGGSLGLKLKEENGAQEMYCQWGFRFGKQKKYSIKFCLNNQGGITKVTAISGFKKLKEYERKGTERVREVCPAFLWSDFKGAFRL